MTTSPTHQNSSLPDPRIFALLTSAFSQSLAAHLRAKLTSIKHPNQPLPNSKPFNRNIFPPLSLSVNFLSSCPFFMPNPGDPTSLHTEPQLSNEENRVHPAPRLQHSPSLPNIWFSSHPGQRIMSQPEPEKGLQIGPSAPPSPIISTDAASNKDKESRSRHVKYASVDPITRIAKQGPKAHARRRTERDQPHALLTPPLTPSSSIRTTTSDSVTTNTKGASEPEPDGDNHENPLESFADLNIGMAGSQSNIRQRFNFPTTASECPNIVVEGAQSPPFFYTTAPFANTSGHGRYQHLDPVHSFGNSMLPIDSLPSSHLGFRGYGVNTGDRNRPYPSENLNFQVPTCYTPDGICSYCPSRTPVSSCTPYAVPCPTPIPVPAYYPAQANPNLMQSVVNVGPFPSQPSFFPYDYMEPQSHPLPSVPQWGFDPAIAAVGAPGPSHLVPIVALNGPSPAPFFIREEATIPVPHFPAPYQQGPTIKEAHLGAAEISPQPFAHIESTYTPDGSPESYPSNSIAKYDPSASCASVNIGPCTERNQLSLARIKAGDDLRTTVMIKNIPNKMSDTDLVAYIDKVCPRRIDFLYLRMDFKNGCNVGYGFVNFITVQDLAHFVEERLGTKWNLFSSEKILQMSYANFQGKEALIEKFKNSAIMDEREAWRPRIFYSSGENQGLPEPFPAPTHIRRKERSSVNRGTLYPPGTNSQIHHLLHNSQRRYNDKCQYLENRRPNERNPSRLREGQPGSMNAIGGIHQNQRGVGGFEKMSGYRAGPR